MVSGILTNFIRPDLLPIYPSLCRRSYQQTIPSVSRYSPKKPKRLRFFNKGLFWLFRL